MLVYNSQLVKKFQTIQEEKRVFRVSLMPISTKISLLSSAVTSQLSLKSYKTAGEAHQREMSLTLSRANNKDIVPYATIQRQPGDQRLSNTSTTKQVASYTASTASTDISALFSNVNEVKGCSFHVYNGPVTIQNQAKRRRFVIESDEEE